MVTRAQVENARSHIEPDGLLATLIHNGVVTEDDVARTLAAQNSMEFVDLANTQVDRKLIELLDADDARRYQAIPIGMRDGLLIIALSDPMAMHIMDGLTYKLRREIEFVCSTHEAVKKLITKYYGDADDAALSLLKGMTLPSGTESTTEEDEEAATEGMHRSSSLFRCFCSKPIQTGPATFISSHWKLSSASVFGLMAFFRKCRPRQSVCIPP